MRVNVKKIIPLLMVLYILIPIQAAYAETLEEQLNNLVGPKEQYNTMLSPVYLRSNTTEESISAQSGELSLSQTDYVLPGINGLDLEIKRIYKSGTSNIQDMKVKYVNGAWVDYIYSDANTSSFYEDRYNLGVGMRFSFPGMEVKTNEDGTRHLFLHTEVGDVYRLRGYLKENEMVYLPENQTIKDVEIRETTEYSNGQADGTSKYRMAGKEGKKTYFAEDGRVLGIVDRYNNTIRFEYSTLTYTIDGTSRSKKLISKITDTVGRVVTLEYKEDFSYTVGPIENRQYSLNDSFTASQNPNSTDSGDLKGKFQVVINLPGDKKIIYDKSAALVSSSKHVIRTRLQRVYDVDGKPKYHFWYDQPELGFTYTNGTSYSAFNRYENLVQIDYCKTNRVKRYTYDKFKRGLSDKGSMEYQKIFEQKELIKKDFDNTNPQFVDRFVYDVKDKATYKYTNEADGFGASDYKEYDNSYLKDTYKYSTEKTDMGGNRTLYTYNGIHELVKNESTGTNHKDEFITEYDEMKFPKKKEVVSYNLETGQAVRKIENFRYDEYGNLTNYTGPLAKRDQNGYPVDNENTVVYSYAYDKYHVPVLKTWKQDADTTSQIIYTVDEKGNIVKEQKVHTSKEENWITTDYQYDSHGNMTRKTVNSSDNNYVTQYEYGVDEDGVDHKGAYLTREYAVVNGQEASRKYTYDSTTGNKKSERDANGNRTDYEYDLLGRLVKTTNPDKTTKSYSYLEYVNADRKIEYTDANGIQYAYEYDILGNQTKSSVYDNNRWNTLKEVEYDYRGNKTKEKDANGHSIRFEYDSAGNLVKKSYYEKDSVNKGNLTLKYTLAYDAETPLLLTITDEEGYDQRYYYNIANRLVKSEATPDKVKYYPTLYTYDYLGNKTSTTDPLGNITKFSYDDLGRLEKKLDAGNNETIYIYNGLDKVLTVQEPGDRMTTYLYDSLGRVDEQRMSKKGSADYVYKKYGYDNAGNATMVLQGDVTGGKNSIASKTEYTYNNMNRVADEYRYMDDNRKGHIKYTYDNNGNKTSMTEFADTAEEKYIKYTYEYDYAGRQKQEEGIAQEPDGHGSYLTHGYYRNRYERDYAGNVLKEQRFNGVGYDETTYTYDYQNKPLQKVEPFKEDGSTKTTEYTYDKKGNLKSQLMTVNGEKRGLTYQYDGMGHVTRKFDALGNTVRYVYDANGNLKKEIDPRYQEMPEEAAPGLEYEYDALNRQVKTISFDGVNRTVLSYKEYDGNGNVTKEAGSEGYNAENPSASIGNRYEYDALNNVIKHTSAQTAKDNQKNGTSYHTMKYTYDGAGRRIAEEDALGYVTRYDYYLNGKLKKKTDADGIGESFEYDLTGKMMTRKTDRAMNVTVTWNTLFGKPYRIEYPDNTYETYDYTTKGALKESRDRAGNSKYFTYDAAGNLLTKKEFISNDGTYMQYKLNINTYDEANNLLSSETFRLQQPVSGGATEKAESAGDKITYAYDKAGRVVKVTGPNGREVINEYDGKGNLITEKRKVRDDYYDVKRYSYDTLSRVIAETVLVEVQDVDLTRIANPEFDQEFGTRIKSNTTYAYYNNGQLKSKKDANGNETLYQYDMDKRLVSKTELPENPQTYVYDLKGNLVEQKNTRGVSTFFEYDNLGRQIRKKTPSADGSIAVNRYIYDAVGNLKKSILPNDYKLELDNDARVNEMTGISYQYDGMSRRTATLSPEGEILEAIKYHANGNAEKIVDGLRFTGDIGTSLGTTYAYDGLGRLLKTTDALGNSVNYEYNVLGHMVKQVDARQNAIVFQYDPDGTLVRATYADTSVIAYGYDKLGRKTSLTDQRGNITYYTYTALGKLKAEKDPYNNSKEFKYDLNGNMVSQKDKRGNVSYFSYDAGNRLKEMRTPLELDASGNILYAVESYTYDGEGNLLRKTLTGTKEKDARREVNYTYYDNNLLATTTDSSGTYKKNYYDKNGNVVKVETLREDGIYDIQKYQYDNKNRLIGKINLVEEDLIYGAGELPAINSLRDAEYPGRIMMITGYEYDLLGNKVKEISPMAYGYLADDQNNRDQYAVRYTYDTLNRLEKIIRKFNGGDVYTQYTYDAAGNKAKERNERGYETQYAYDNMNRLETLTDAYLNTFSYGYDKAGNKITETNAKQQTITYGYDKLNRLETVTDAYNTVISRNLYDANGNVIKSMDAKGYLSANNDNDRYGTLYTYDLANRLVKVVDPEIAAYKDPTKFSMKYEYNQFGEKVKAVDALENTTTYEYDSAGRLIKVANLPEPGVSYGYDKAGNKLHMVDGRGKITRYAYGAFGMLKAVTDADNKAIQYKYNLAGSAATIQDRNGNTTLYTYDNRNLLTQKRVVETGNTVKYSYDEGGNRVSMEDESGTSTYSYDKNNRMLEISKNGVQQISYSYDVIGNIETVTDSKDFTTTYAYDNSNRLQTVTFAGKTTTYTYDKNGNREAVEYQGGVKETYTYDKNNRLKALVNKKPDGSVLSSYSYTYYDNGLQKTKTDSYGITTYTYDAAGRVLKVEAPGKTTVYAYDKAGNRLSQNETYTSAQPSGTIDEASGNEIQYILKKSEYIYSNTNRLLKLVEKMFDAANKEVLQKTTAYYYDDNGNELRQNSSYIAPHNIKKSQSTKGSIQGDDMAGSIDTLVERTSNTFDGFNRLKKVENVKSGVRTLAEYTYNGDDLRVKKAVKKSDKDYMEEVTNYLYDRQHVVLETDGSNNLKARYIRGINYIARMDASSKLSYFLYNGHGDVVQTVTEIGEIENQYDYDIWGNPTLTIEYYDCGIRYAGEYFDRETGMYYLRARYYDPHIGRFVSEDSYWGEDDNPLSLNLYTYAANNPIMYIDPSGHFFGFSAFTGAGVVGAMSMVVSGVVKAAEAVSNVVSSFISDVASDSSTGTSSSTFIFQAVSTVATGIAVAAGINDAIPEFIYSAGNLLTTIADKLNQKSQSSSIVDTRTNNEATVKSKEGALQPIVVLTQEQKLEEDLKSKLSSIGLEWTDGYVIDGQWYNYLDLLKNQPLITVGNGSSSDLKTLLLQNVYKQMGFDVRSNGVYDDWHTFSATRALMAYYGIGWVGDSGGGDSDVGPQMYSKIIDMMDVFSELDANGKEALRNALGSMQEGQYSKAMTWEEQERMQQELARLLLEYAKALEQDNGSATGSKESAPIGTEQTIVAPNKTWGYSTASRDTKGTSKTIKDNIISGYLGFEIKGLEIINNYFGGAYKKNNDLVISGLNSIAKSTVVENENAYNFGKNTAEAAEITANIVMLKNGLKQITTSGGQIIVNNGGEVVQVVSGSLEGVGQSAVSAGLTLKGLISAAINSGGNSLGGSNASIKVNKGQQDKHIPGTNNYKQELANGKPRSTLSEDPQQLLNDYAGTGQKIGTNKERVDFGKKIGQYYDSATGTYTDTTKGIIHYDSKGQAHIVPARP